MENGLGIDFRNADPALWGQRTEGSGGGSGIQREDTKEATLGPQRNNHSREPATVLWASKRVNSLSQGRRGCDPFLGTSHPKHEKGNTSKTSQHCTAKTVATAGICGPPQTIRVLLLLWLLSLTNIQKAAHSLYPYLLPEGHLFRDEPNSQRKCSEERLGCLLRFSLEALPAG